MPDTTGVGGTSTPPPQRNFLNTVGKFIGHAVKEVGEHSPILGNSILSINKAVCEFLGIKLESSAQASASPSAPAAASTDAPPAAAAAAATTDAPPAAAVAAAAAAAAAAATTDAPPAAAVVRTDSVANQQTAPFTAFENPNLIPVKFLLDGKIKYNSDGTPIIKESLESSYKDTLKKIIKSSVPVMTRLPYRFNGKTTQEQPRLQDEDIEKLLEDNLNKAQIYLNRVFLKHPELKNRKDLHANLMQQAIFTALKYESEASLWNIDFTGSPKESVKPYHQMEREFLKLIDYELFVKEQNLQGKQESVEMPSSTSGVSVSSSTSSTPAPGNVTSTLEKEISGYAQKILDGKKDEIIKSIIDEKIDQEQLDEIIDYLQNQKALNDQQIMELEIELLSFLPNISD